MHGDYGTEINDHFEMVFDIFSVADKLHVSCPALLESLNIKFVEPFIEHPVYMAELL